MYRDITCDQVPCSESLLCIAGNKSDSFPVRGALCHWKTLQLKQLTLSISEITLDNIDRNMNVFIRNLLTLN